MPNFQPLSALFLCGMVFLPGMKGWALPLAAWLISYPFSSLTQGYTPFTHAGDYVALATLLLTAALAIPLRRRPAPGLIFGAGILAAILFHTVTNTAAWIADPLHAKTASGYWQAVWSGRPTDPMPTWIFLRNLLAANTLFIAIYLVARRTWLPSPAAAPALVSHHR